MKPYRLMMLAVIFSALSNVAVAQQEKSEEKKTQVPEQENVPQVPQQETYPGRVTGQTPSPDPGGVRGTAPPSPGAGERQDSVTVVPPGNRTPGAPPGTVTAVEPRGAFGEADKNRSGFIEEDEAASVEGLNLSTADADQDGRLSISEFEAATRDSEASPPAGSGASGSGGASDSSGGKTR